MNAIASTGLGGGRVEAAVEPGIPAVEDHIPEAEEGMTAAQGRGPEVGARKVACRAAVLEEVLVELVAIPVAAGEFPDPGKGIFAAGNDAWGMPVVD